MNPPRQFLMILGSVTLVIAVIGTVFYTSPVGFQSLCALGIVAGLGWLAAGIALYRSRVLMLVYMVFVIVALVGAVPLLLVGLFTLNPTAGDNFILSHQQIPDAHLGSVIAPGAWGHDANGFRNPRVPDHADVVALGDSQTWGINAARDKTWPSVLADLSGQTVYNQGSPGFGPMEYRVLLADALADFSPHTVIVALYLGNDLYDAYESIYFSAPHAAYRDPAADLFDDTAGRRANDISRNRCDGRYSGGGVDTQFTIAYRTVAVNFDDPRITEGLRITHTLLDEMHTLARAAGVDLLVVLIPTKERAYADLVAQAADPALDRAEFQRLVDFEQRANQAIKAQLDAAGIAYVDVQPALTAALQSGEAVYRDSTDGHPTETGYRVIAETANRAPPPGSTGSAGRYCAGPAGAACRSGAAAPYPR